ncbi:GNAT family N-acetyltransferase [Sulfitobacter sp. M57]|uniref:GNAT family N-acetyltransferase n=1 Tax=unclassified Sulfitobacter TaxID=196795 RepID=UPI0023E13860|nr:MULTISPECIES: GNAT family N-acetyltransferase [unclassified Sulfitobacter]MDF3413910.1 GNAT family N-acetyltransferase [Sulfitobacter sp. KE5]MDF3420809.1 GNAT family N-acetyltransferase [Sulfitobacter sp. KE43]MDF3432456.1 GNAT family N-acetyltransferase [Sulfitobacter sp. KE42]MDF3458095.1 GNAT family N-acetyltransferase [Sulfitobacter sp. S74]MDF3461996.1 GNAT family N-acetyltransferase [Sulfitobacter sp. Ks18]
MSRITLTHATRPDDLNAVRALCWAYRDFLLSHSDIDRDITETFYPVAKYTALMADLPILHARPKGIVLLARDADGTALGCGMTHALDDETSEVKRVFVSDRARGKGVAALICTALITQAKTDGFTRIVLDTSKSLHAAQRLYQRLGFTPCAPYQPIPKDVLPELLFYERAL